jgi:hypothetical protein
MFKEELCKCNHPDGYHCGVGKYAGECIVVNCECKKFKDKKETMAKKVYALKVASTGVEIDRNESPFSPETMAEHATKLNKAVEMVEIYENDSIDESFTVFDDILVPCTEANISI